MTLLLSRDDVARVLTMPACIDAVEGAFAALARGEADMPQRAVIKVPDLEIQHGTLPQFVAAVREALENQQNLDLFQQAVDDLIVEHERVVGVVTRMGLKVHAKAVVLTVGTFLGGRIHIGLDLRRRQRLVINPDVINHPLKMLSIETVTTDLQRVSNKISWIQRGIIAVLAEILANVPTGCPLVFALPYGFPAIRLGLPVTIGPFPAV